MVIEFYIAERGHYIVCVEGHWFNFPAFQIGLMEAYRMARRLSRNARRLSRSVP